MSEIIDISIWGMIFTYLLLIAPLLFTIVYKVKIKKQILISTARMSLQLFLIGFFLEYIFNLNNYWLNIGWVILMVLNASWTVIRRTDMAYKYMYIPVFISILIMTLGIVFYFIGAIVQGNTSIFAAQYFIVLSGMIMGNSLKSNIIGIQTFYSNLRKEEGRYRYFLASGASKSEALYPYFKDAIKNAVNPTLASMATMGIITLPGMMTGQILGGNTPFSAVKYQIAIMITIFTSILGSTALTILLTWKTNFMKNDLLNPAIFKDK